MRALFILLLLWPAVAWGQPPYVKGIAVPEEIPEYTIGTAVLDGVDIPEAAEIVDGGWEVTPELKPEQILRDGETVLHFTGKPGSYDVVFDGVIIEVVTFKDGDGNDVTIRSYLGRIKESATFKILGDSEPDPDPDPVEELGVIIIEDAARRTYLPYGQVQAMTLPDIRDLPAMWDMWDKDVEGPDGSPPDELVPFLEKADSYPYLFLVNQDKQIVWEGMVPEGADAMRALIKSYLPDEPEAAQAAVVDPVTPRYIQRTRCVNGRCYTTWELAQ